MTGENGLLPGDYMLQFARIIVQILVLVLLVLLITRYPTLINNLSGVLIEIELRKDR